MTSVEMDTKACTIEGCERKHLSRGWCSAHYWRWRHYGDPLHGGSVRPLGRGYARDATERECIGCHLVKPADQFYRKTDGHLRSKCIPCWSDDTRAYVQADRVAATERARRYRKRRPDVHRRGSLKFNYGLTLEQFLEMYESQDGCCIMSFCRRKFDGPFDRRVHVDHDHATGEVRALLCHRCNQGLGFFQDNPSHLLIAVEYLLKVR